MIGRNLVKVTEKVNQLFLTCKSFNVFLLNLSLRHKKFYFIFCNFWNFRKFYFIFRSRKIGKIIKNRILVA